MRQSDIPPELAAEVPTGKGWHLAIVPAMEWTALEYIITYRDGATRRRHFYS